MKRRMFVMCTALVAGSLTVGVIVPAATGKSSAKPKVTVVTCKSNVTTEIPVGATSVIPPVSNGTQYGPVRCAKLGQGVQADTLTAKDSGDVAGSFTFYLGAGSVRGSYVLSPGEGQPLSSTGFASATYTGKWTIAGGTGAFAGARGTGTSTCSTADGLHLSCTDKVRLSKL